MNHGLLINVGLRIKQLRKAHKLSEKALGDLTNISQPVICRLENNTKVADVDYLDRICKVFGITLAEFFTETDQELPPELQRVIEKVKKLRPDKVLVLESVLDSWTE